jgi:hypothetical protein
MASSGMLRHVALVGIDVSKELSASIISVTRIGELGTTLAVIRSPTLVTLMMEALRSSETSVLTRVTRSNTPEDAILYLQMLSLDTWEGVAFYLCVYWECFTSIKHSTHDIIGAYYISERYTASFIKVNVWLEDRAALCIRIAMNVINL